MIALILLAINLSFTLPNELAATRSDTLIENQPPVWAIHCELESYAPLTDLDSLFVRGNIYPGFHYDTLLYSASVQRMEGQPYTVAITLPPSSYGTLYVITSRRGNRSCVSAPFSFNWPLSAPEPETFTDVIRWYDIMGRRINQPQTTGIYWRQKGKSMPHKVVIVR